MPKNLNIGIRTSKGAVIVEGAISIVLIIASTIIAGVFLLNVGVSTYHKQRLAFLTNQAAEFAYSQMSRQLEFQQATDRFVRDYMPRFGIPVNNLVVEVTRGSIAINGDAVPTATVRITNTFNLLGRVNFLPTNIRLTERAAASSAVTVLAAAGPPGPQGPPGPPSSTAEGINSAPAFIRMGGMSGPSIWLPVARVGGDATNGGPNYNAFGAPGVFGKASDPPVYTLFSPELAIPQTIPQNGQAANYATSFSSLGGDLSGF